MKGLATRARSRGSEGEVSPRIAALVVALGLLAGAAAAFPLLAAAAASVTQDDRFERAQNAFEAGDYDKSAELLRAYLKNSPHHDAQVLLGWSVYRRGDFAGAERAFKAAQSLDPHSTDALVGLGFAQLQQGAPEEAARLFRQALALQDGLYDALVGLVYAAARPSVSRSLAEEGRAAALRVLEKNPADDEVPMLLLQVEAVLGQSVERRLRPPADPSRPLRIAFRAGRDYLEVRGKDGSFRPIFVKGVNLGPALPGRFATEAPVDEGPYRDWLEAISDLGANTVRLYTLLPPAFYSALEAHNEEHAKTPLWLIQGVWTELPPRHDFDDPDFLAEFRSEIARVIDAVHGNIALPPRPGHAGGIYTADVSHWTLAFIIGREWEPFAVQDYETLHPGVAAWRGSWFTTLESRAMERWVARVCEYAAGYEAQRHRELRPLTFANWPTLDPLAHPTEASCAEEDAWRERYGIPRQAALRGAAWEDDAATLDATRIRPTPAMKAGFFAAYHIYPNFPDFLNNEPSFAEARDADGPSRYAGYLRALKARHGEQPVLVAEFGISTSRGVAHLQPDGWHHGGHDERAQGELVSRMLRSIRDERFAGGVIFEFMDEWFKTTWSTAPLEIPDERRRLWFNTESPEESYGLVAARPGSASIRVDGDERDWSDRAPLLVAGAERGKGWAGLRELRAAADEGFVYILLKTAGDGAAPDWSRTVYRLAIDTYDAKRGERTLPSPGLATTPTGVEFLVDIAGPGRSVVNVSAPYEPFGSEFGPFFSPGAPAGAFVGLSLESNRERFARDGRRFPARRVDRGALRFGSLDPSAPEFDTRTDVAVGQGVVELRLPWSLLNVTDPSSGKVLHQETEHAAPFDAIDTEGFRFYAFALDPRALESGVESQLPAAGAIPPTWSWPRWNEPKFRLDLKLGADRLRRTLRGTPTFIDSPKALPPAAAEKPDAR